MDARISTSVYCWGYPDLGQTGRDINSIHNYNSVPNLIQLEESEEEIFTASCGEFHSVILTTNFQVYSFGKNSNGQLGLGHNLNVHIPLKIQAFDKVKIFKISCGGEHTLALSDTNDLYSFGLNIFGQLGLGDYINKNFPVKVELELEENEHIKDISTGSQHSLFSTSFNNLYSSGCGKVYALGNGKTQNLTKFTKIEGNIFKGKEINKISSGVYHSACILGNETVIVWGKGKILQFELPTQLGIAVNSSPSKTKSNLHQYKDLKIGEDVIYLLTFKNELYSMGQNMCGQLGSNHYLSGTTFDQVNLEGNKCQQIECGYSHAIALTSDKQLFTWGSNKYGQLSLLERGSIIKPTPLVEISKSLPCKIVCGAYHSLAFFSKIIPEEILEEQVTMIDSKLNLKKNEITNLNLKLTENNDLLKQREDNIRKLSEALNEKQKLLSEINEQLEKIQKQKEDESLFENNLVIDIDLIKDKTVIGKGAFGIVYYGSYNDTSVAVKESNDCNSEKVLKAFNEEYKFLKNLRHPNILLLIGISTRGNKLSLITEFCQNGSLFGLLHQNTNINISWNERLRIAMEIAKGMVYLHHSFKPPILHRDLKSLNVLLDKNFIVKIGDLGTMKFLDPHMTGQVGTVQWMAPEVLNNRPYTEKADVFSFAIILHEIATRKKPYLGVQPNVVKEMVKTVKNFRPEIPNEKTPPGYIQLMTSCWDYDPAKRPSFEQIMIVLKDISKVVKKSLSNSRSNSQEK